MVFLDTQSQVRVPLEPNAAEVRIYYLERDIIIYGGSDGYFVVYRNRAFNPLGTWLVCLQPGRVGARSPGAGGYLDNHLVAEADIPLILGAMELSRD
jgi:hypothetical protein